MTPAGNELQQRALCEAEFDDLYVYAPGRCVQKKSDKGKGKFTEQEVQAMANVD